MSEPGHDNQLNASSEISFMKSNRGVAAVLMAIIAILALNIWFSDWAHQEMRDGFLLGGFPLAAICLLAVSVTILLLDRQARAVEPGLAAFSLAAGLVVLGGAAVLGLTFLAFDTLGFMPAVALFILATSTLLGYRPIWSAAIVGIAVAGALRTIMFALNVEISDGVIWAVVIRLVG